MDAVDPADVRSVLELRFLRMCAFHGIPRPLVNIRVGEWTPDFLWPEHRLVVETDGAAFHRARSRWPAETARRILDHHECRLGGHMRHRDDIRRLAAS